MHRELTTQEVIKELNKLKTGAPCTDISRRDKAIEKAKEATKMREARKPKYYRYEGGGYECPNCYELLLEKHDCYCSNCGQAIDWSDYYE